MKSYKKILVGMLAWCFAMSVSGTNEQTCIDSITNASDSIVQALRSQVQELKLQGIMMQEQLERTGKSAREDSLQKVRRQARIDSLRKFIPGAPLVIDGDTLLKLYNRKGGVVPEKRVVEIRERLLDIGMSMTLFPDSVYVYEGDYTTDIMAGERVIMSVTENDGLWQNMSRQKLAREYAKIFQAKIDDLHAEYGLKQKILGVFYVVLLITALGLLIWLVNKLYKRWKFKLLRLFLKRAKPLAFKNYELLNLHRVGIALLTIYNVLRWAIILMLLLFCVPLLFALFPETKSFTYTIFGYIWDPLTHIFSSVVGFLPNFFQIVVIVFCFRYLVKGLRYFMNEIAVGKLKINGFYADWAQPTYYILRVLLYSFMLVMIWPLLPNSNSEVFQGVSVFIGIIVSLGSSSIIGNVMAGMVMTYMRPFRIGDFIRFGENEGFVIEKTVLVTRIKTRKNEVITIPNSNLMGSQTTNFSFSAKNYGIIVHTKVTIGYDMKWELIRGLLIQAAQQTAHISKHPEPFVIVTALDDFYVEYEINAYTHKPEMLPLIYSDLRQHILDGFHEAGVEIMSPHIFAHRNDLELQIPKK